MIFSDIYTEIMGYIPDSKITEEAAKKYANRAYKQMAMSFQFYGTEQEGTFNTANGTLTYAIGTVASGAKVILGIYNETEDQPLMEETIQWWDRILEDPTAVTEAPIYWVRYGDNIQLYPTPDGIYSLRIRYKTNPASLSADNDIPVFPEEWHEAIVLSGASKAAFFYGYTNIGINLKNEFLGLVGSLQEEHTLQSRQRIGQISVQRTRSSRGRHSHWHPEFC